MKPVMTIHLVLVSAMLLSEANGVRDCSWRNGRQVCRRDCVPEEMEGRSYTYLYCKEDDARYLAGCHQIPNGPYTAIRFNCGRNYSMEGRETINCSAQESFPTCEKMCSPVTTQDALVDIVCMYEGSPVACGQPLKHGTTVRANCKYPFVPVHGSGDETVQCGYGGELTGHLIQCRFDETLRGSNLTINIFNIYVQSDNYTAAIPIIQSLLRPLKP